MKKNLKLAVLLASSTLVAAISVGSIIVNKKIKTNADGVVWQHYSAVKPGLETRGSKEYWINCSTFEHVFEEPLDSSILEKGTPSMEEIASWDATDDRVIPQYKIDDSHLWYGYYPQTRVGDETLLSILGSLTVKNEQGYYSYKGDFYAKKYSEPYYNTYAFDDGTTIAMRTYYWFKVEPIVWDILASNDGNYFLNCSKLLINHRYAASSNNYADSELRSFMNGDFYNQAFFLDDSLIQVTEVDNSPSTTISFSNTYTCDNTNDKIFALSCMDYLNESYGFSSAYSKYDSARRCKTTDYARASGAWCSSNSSYLNNGYSWTRSPDSSDSSYVSYVYYSGSLNNYNVDFTYYCIRPAMNIKVA